MVVFLTLVVSLVVVSEHHDEASGKTEMTDQNQQRSSDNFRKPLK